MAAVTTAAPVSALAVFRNRSFTLLWTAQLVSTIGSALTSLAASILVYRETGSALSVGLMLMATAAPSVVLGLIAGVFVDRLDRKRIMVVSDITRAALVLAIPFLVSSSIAWLYVIVLLTSCVGQFFDPAQSSVLPEVASDEELAAANSLMAISSFGATAVGFAASGLLAQISIEWAFYLDALTFVFSAACISLTRIPKIKPEGETSVSNVLHNMRAGIKYLFGSQILRSTYIVFPLIGISFGLANALLLPFATRALHATEFEYGIQEGLTSLGFVAGSLLMARVADRLAAGQWLVISYIGMGVCQLIYSQLNSVAIAFFFVTVSGFMNAPSVVARQLVLQRNTPREMRGRVASVYFVTRDVSFLVGMGLTALADVIGVRELYFLSALIVLVPGVLCIFLPGLGQPAEQWKHVIQLLRTAQHAPAAQVTRTATLADIDALALRFGALSALSPSDRHLLASNSHIVEAPAGTTIVRRGEKSDAAYFLMNGHAVAGVEEGGETHWLETMGAGDFFGEIAALSGMPRTANVVAQGPTMLLQVPAQTLRHLMSYPSISQAVRVKFYERLTRTNLTDLPRFAGMDQATLKELRLEGAS
ncbi:MAG TPA: MFS transporter [Anaerolineae bacterium]|nr:MFS transporter [Anaerolineae bacterium]